MPKTKFTQAEVDGFFKQKKEVFGLYYDRTIDFCEAMRVHADGVFPASLIDERRPNEPLDVKDYRKKIFKAKTKPTFSKVYSSLQKIRRSQDWSIRYHGADEFPRIAPDETLEEYCETNFPFFTSLTNWVFSLFLRKYLIDSNSVVFIKPITFDVAENEFLQPFPEVFDSVNVLIFVPEDYAVLRVPNGCIYYVRNQPQKGTSFYLVTTQSIFRYDQISARDYKLTVAYEHGLEILPVFKTKGVLIDQSEDQYLYESRISGMLPELDEAIREYSDLQAGVVTSLYMERWEYTQNECGVCKGSGLRPNPAWTEDCGCDRQVTCNAPGCNKGYVVAGPYSKILVRPSNNAIEGQVNIPMPPAGYIEKDVEIIKLQDQRVKDHIYNALASINFEFLADTPLAQSGVAKDVDRDELNNTVNSIAEDIVEMMDNIYWATARYRYKLLYPMDEVDMMLPVVNVPEKFDLLSAGVALKELTDAKTGKINPVILSAMEVDYSGKRFNTEPEVRDLLMLILTLDPLPNISDEEKMTRLSNNGITQEIYIISSNIQAFVQRAIAEDKNFAGKKLEEQKAVLLGYAEEQKNAAAALIVNTDPEDNIYGGGI